VPNEHVIKVNIFANLRVQKNCFTTNISKNTHTQARISMPCQCSKSTKKQKHCDYFIVYTHSAILLIGRFASYVSVMSEMTQKHDNKFYCKYYFHKKLCVVVSKFYVQKITVFTYTGLCKAGHTYWPNNIMRRELIQEINLPLDLSIKPLQCASKSLAHGVLH
jgi:hypothetical protein